MGGQWQGLTVTGGGRHGSPRLRDRDHGEGGRCRGGGYTPTPRRFLEFAYNPGEAMKKKERAIRESEEVRTEEGKKGLRNAMAGWRCAHKRLIKMTN